MQRFVYYVEAAVATLSNVDPSRGRRFRNKIESFLDTPHSAFAKSLSPHTRQIKHRGAKLRAFVTWCQDDTREVLVVHTIYRKRNETRYFDRLDDYDDEGRQFKEQFRELSNAEFDAWRESVKAHDELILVES